MERQKCLYQLKNDYSTNTPNMLELSNNLKISETKNTSLVYYTIGPPRKLKTGGCSRALSREPRKLSLMKKFKRSYQGITNLGS